MDYKTSRNRPPLDKGGLFRGKIKETNKNKVSYLSGGTTMGSSSSSSAEETGEDDSRAGGVGGPSSELDESLRCGCAVKFRVPVITFRTRLHSHLQNTLRN